MDIKDLNELREEMAKIMTVVCAKDSVPAMIMKATKANTSKEWDAAGDARRFDDHVEDMIADYCFEPRPYQLPLLRALDRGATRAVVVWHRRAGKDKTCLNWLIPRTQERVGAYFYCYPTYTQAKKAIWDGRDKDGFWLPVQ
jgi:hypothetical protein